MLKVPFVKELITEIHISWGTRWRSWLRHWATRRKVAGSIPDGVILPVSLWPCGRLSLLHKWVPGIFPGGKGGRCVELTTLSPSCADRLEIWEPQSPGTLCNGTALHFVFTHYILVQAVNQPSACCCTGPGSTPGQYLWDLCWEKWLWYVFFSAWLGLISQDHCTDILSPIYHRRDPILENGGVID